MSNKADFERDLMALDQKHPGKLSTFLLGTIGMYLEYRDLHGKEDEAAQWAAINEMVEGSKAMIDLDDDGEL